MNKALEVCAVLVGGLLIGYSFGVYSRTKSYPIELKMYDSQLVQTEGEKVDVVKPPRKAADESSIFGKSLDEDSYESYSQFAEDYKESDSSDSDDEDDEDDDEEYASDQCYDVDEDPYDELKGEPYSITQEDYEYNAPGHTQECWTYYLDDQLIADSYGNPVGIPEMFVGHAFDIMRNAIDGTTMHWRAPQSRMDISLMAVRDPYDESFVPKREALQRQVAEMRKRGGE